MSRPPAPLPLPLPRVDASLLEALAGLYRELEVDLTREGATCSACGDCCHLAARGHELWLTGHELSYLVHLSGRREPTTPGVCPYLEGDRCAARQGRSLGCRIYHCELDPAIQERLHQQYFERLRLLVAARGEEGTFGELLASLSALAARNGSDG